MATCMRLLLTLCLFGVSCFASFDSAKLQALWSRALMSEDSLEHLFARGVTCEDIEKVTLKDVLKSSCYKTSFKNRCSAICEKYYTGNQGCPYGNKNPNYCKQHAEDAAEECQDDSSLFSKNCCQTCLNQSSKRLLKQMIDELF